MKMNVSISFNIFSQVALEFQALKMTNNFSLQLLEVPQCVPYEGPYFNENSIYLGIFRVTMKNFIEQNYEIISFPMFFKQ